MANSKYEYVRSFEQPDSLLANTWIVVRIDGRGFSKLTTKYKFVKPNDQDALDLMNAAAEAVMKELPDLVIAYGNSDEYSFVFHRECALFERRASKLTTTIVSTFTSYYVFLWSKYLPDKPLTPPLPSFDGRAVCYPSDFNLRDYMSWRQVDCHINNLYNTTFWTLVQKGGMGAREAERKLSGTVSADKNEILFKEFGINYNNEPECFKKGTVLYRDFFPPPPIEKTASPAVPNFPSPPIAQPQPRRVSSRSMSQPIERVFPYLQDQELSRDSSGPGPTFLSTTSTPSPPPTPPMMSRAALPNPLRSNPVSPRNSSYPTASAMPISPPSTVTSPYGNLASPHGKQPLPTLTPLPLSPLTLKPSTKPPLSLNPPNPTTRTNFSPTSPPHDFPAAFPISGYSHKAPVVQDRPISHSASASMSNAAPRTGHKQRSPSQPHLPTYFAADSSPPGPPVIPLRISSIPTNNKPRKLSLQNHRSFSTLKPKRNSYEEKENIVSSVYAAGSSTPRKVSPPLRTNKALPSPPMSREEELRTREKVMESSPPQEWSLYATTSVPPHRRVSDSDKRGGQVWLEQDVCHPGIAELPAVLTRRTQSYSRLHSAPTSSSLSYPHQTPDVQALSSNGTAPRSHTLPSTTSTPTPDTELVIHPTPPLKNSPRSKIPQPLANTAKDPSCRPKEISERVSSVQKTEHFAVEQGGWASSTHAADERPVKMSRNQRDKDRKKRSKAKVLIEHVDIIRDEFWEKRPWILSGKTG